MPAPALLLGAVKKRAILKLAGTALSALVLCCVMAFCGSMALMAVAAKGSTAACSVAAGGPGTAMTITVPRGMSVGLNAAQVAVARSYIAVGRARLVPEDGIVIALMMALQESDLQMLANPSVPESLNYPHDGVGSDHDSIGSAQQRPSAGWGSVAQLMQPDYNAEAFYGGPQGPNHGSPPGLLDVPGWQQMDKGAAAQAVQGSAFPERYAQWQPAAEQILRALATSTGPAACSTTQQRPGQPTLPANLSQLRRTILAYAQQGVGGAYVWGGTAYKAWDCSGYVQWVFGQAGITLPRTEQWTAGTRTTNPQPGDLVVQNPDGPNHWGHIGIYAGNGMMYSALNPDVGTLLHPVAWNSGSAYFRVSM
ncbi:C40 family peptidase [Arthrobacter sp. A2-55]|uniref:C40 family peptidase n=1 Tax=Arthrobacter sp. A2-55 TaxID=2897337 RepID=UPI0021CDB496|nr:NlpC/P60 family protein [Arthrobacter sp. A2-55]MCU6479787.1 NlpC/P60 family protein [Arthrobacter sp. A2-55]